MPAQLPDKVLYNKECRSLYTNPLEMYWSATGKPRPRFVVHQDCRRGYVATWEIHENQLFLREIRGFIRRKFSLFRRNLVAYSLDNLFGKCQKSVKATWFSGKLRIPTGKMTMFSDNAYDSRFEKEVIITVTRGDLVRVAILDCINQRLIVESWQKPG